jgi:hypothetical protein
MRYIYIILLMIFIQSCTDPEEGSTYAGNYKGSTNQSFSVSFFVDSSGHLANSYIKIRITQSGQETEKEFSNWKTSVDSNGNFTANLDIDGYGKIKGKFIGNNVSGEWSYPDDFGTASGTWNCSRK